MRAEETLAALDHDAKRFHGVPRLALPAGFLEIEERPVRPGVRPHAVRARSEQGAGDMPPPVEVTPVPDYAPPPQGGLEAARDGGVARVVERPGPVGRRVEDEIPFARARARVRGQRIECAADRLHVAEVT